MCRRRLLVLVLTLIPGSIAPALSQGARSSEAQACFDQRLDQPADLQNRMAACSRVVGDASQGADRRADAYLRRGFAYAQRADQSKSKEDVDHALADLSEGSRLAPSNPGVQKYVLETRAGLFLRNGAYDRAVADYTALLGLEPNSAPGYAYRGLAGQDQRGCRGPAQGGATRPDQRRGQGRAAPCAGARAIRDNANCGCLTGGAAGRPQPCDPPRSRQSCPRAAERAEARRLRPRPH
jgi:tetratricopeptide (TPR) repeat protein